MLVAERGGVVMGTATMQERVIDHGVEAGLLDGLVRHAKKRRFKALHVLVGHGERSVIDGHRAGGWVPDGRVALVRPVG